MSGKKKGFRWFWRIMLISMSCLESPRVHGLRSDDLPRAVNNLVDSNSIARLKGVVGKTTSLRKALWAFTCVGTVFLSLWFLRFFYILGSEYDILVRWTSVVGLVLFGVAIGIAISEKKFQVRGMIAFSLLFSAGFLVAPLVGVGILMLAEALPISRVNAGIIFGGSIVAYLLLYMGLWFWLKKKGVLKLGTMNGTEK